MIHDLCELYTGDETPYDKILPRNKEEWPELFDKWPRSTRSEKIRKQREKYQKELNAFRRLVSKLPPKIKQEISELWLEYEEMRTEEARFVKQVNRVQKLLQALVYGQEQKIPVYKSWWIGSKEKVDDPVLIKFMDELERKFYPKNPKNKK